MKQSFFQWLKIFGIPLLALLPLLLIGLGSNALTGSEGRWLIIAREMMISQEYWHATINYYPYPDKPLLTYWFIVLVSQLNHGNVTEFIGRLPSVIMALGVVYLTIKFTRLLFSSSAARISGYLAVTSVSVALYGRLAEADMANIFFVMAAVVLYVRFREKSSFWLYLAVGCICAVGAHAKGMAAFAVPAVVILSDLWVFKRWKTHFVWKAIPAAILTLLIYLLPFVFAAVNVHDSLEFSTPGSFSLAIRENIVRFIAPFDHKEPFYAYFIHVPRHLLPWTPFFVLAVIWYVKFRKKLSQNWHFLALSIGLIFLFFSLSGSKRHYYILPILPFCLTFTAVWLNNPSSGIRLLDKLKSLMLKIMTWTAPALTVLLCILALVLQYFTWIHPALEAVSEEFGDALAIAAVLGLTTLFGFLALARCRKVLLYRAILSFWLCSMVIHGYMIMEFTSLRTGKDFYLDVCDYLDKMSQNQTELKFYMADTRMVEAAFYLQMRERIPSIGHEIEASELPEDAPVWIIGQIRDFADFDIELQQRTMVLLEEKTQPWETDPEKLRKKMQLRVLLPKQTE